MKDGEGDGRIEKYMNINKKMDINIDEQRLLAREGIQSAITLSLNTTNNYILIRIKTKMVEQLFCSSVYKLTFIQIIAHLFYYFPIY